MMTNPGQIICLKLITQRVIVLGVLAAAGFMPLWLKPQSVRSNLLKQVHGYGWINRF